MKGRSMFAALAISAAVSTSAFAQIKGAVTLDGPAPKAKEIKMAAVADCAKQHKDPVFDETIVAGEKGELKNVVVFIKAEEGAPLGGEVPKTDVVLDQKGCVYTPHVLAMMVGQEFKVKNSDPFLHNVHGLAKDNGEFNFPQNKGDEKSVKGSANKTAEKYKIKCDVHPWMGAWVYVFDHPFFAVTGDDGTYTIDTKGLKDGEYTLVAWQEKMQTVEQKVNVKNGKVEAAADFKFKPKAAAADPTVKELFVSKPADEACEECCPLKKGAAAAQNVAAAGQTAVPAAAAK